MLTTLKTTSSKPLNPLQQLTDNNKPSETVQSHFYKHSGSFELECGEVFSELALSYTTYGTLNKDASNVIWICHAFTANANPNEWWPGMVGERDFYNPKEHFIVCANILGSAYGSTSPLNCDEDKRYSQFPLITVRDIVNTMILLRKHLGVAKIHTLIGGSIGGHQALEWAIMEPNHILNLILCATSAQTSPWVTAFNQSQRLAIEA
ncbi:MAG: alpha/beta fold hydrolase, partial [Xanthomonadales bacterium]|nr:alpha/beta fold hydrolase [Xanthomonadales bacterium]